MAQLVKNNLKRQLPAWWAKRASFYQRMLLTAGENAANRYREGYSGITRQGYDTGGWKEGKAPVLHGQLRQSARVDRTGIMNFQIAILIGKEYGAFVEFGTSEVEGRPALTNALRIEAPFAKRQVKALK